MAKRILSASSGNILAAARRIKEGGLVVYPTDTVYGLGCDPFNVEAVERIFKVKNRRRKPLPILASNVGAVQKIAFLSETSRRVADAFWPGPLTIVVPKKPPLPKIVTGNLTSVGVRVPKHDIALHLLRASGGLLVGTSANKTGQEAPVTAREAVRLLGSEVDLILDGGPTTLGISSTVVDLRSEKVKILRQGPIRLEEIVGGLF